MTKCGANLFILPPQILWSLYLARGAYSSNFIILENVKMLQINAFLQISTNDQFVTIWINRNLNLFILG